MELVRSVTQKFADASIDKYLFLLRRYRDWLPIGWSMRIARTVKALFAVHLLSLISVCIVLSTAYSVFGGLENRVLASKTQ